MTPQRLTDFIPLAFQSLTQPKVILRHILSIPVPRQGLITAGWLVIVLGMLVSEGLTLILPNSTGGQDNSMVMAGLILAIIGVFGGAVLLHRVGISFDGNTDFDDSLKTVVWLNFILLLIQIPLPFANAISAEAFSLASMVVVVVTVIQITAMVMELHGFTKVMPVLLGVLGAQFLFGVIVIFVFQIMGMPIAPTQPVS